MPLVEQINRYFSDARHRVELSYRELEAINFDTGFRTRLQDGVEQRSLTHPIVTAAQRFSQNGLEVITFSGLSPIMLIFPIAEPRYAVQDYVEIRYVLEGEHYIDLDGTVERFDAGEICLTSSLTPTREVPSKSRCTVLNVCLERSLLDEELLGEVTLTPLQAYLRANVLRQSDCRPFIRFSPLGDNLLPGPAEMEFVRRHPEQAEGLSLIETELSFLFGESHYRVPGSGAILRGHVIRMMDRLSTIYQLDREQHASSDYDDVLFASVDGFIAANLDCVTLDMLSNEFGYHPNYFNELVKRHTGATYSAYVIRLRIVRAQQLLARTDLSVDQVCRLVGYNNRGFFYRKFSEECGMSPAAWRKRSRK